MSAHRHSHAGGRYPNWYNSEELRVSQDGNSVTWEDLNNAWCSVVWLSEDCFEIIETLPGLVASDDRVWKVYGLWVSTLASFRPLVVVSEIPIPSPPGGPLKGGKTFFPWPGESDKKLILPAMTDDAADSLPSFSIGLKTFSGRAIANLNTYSVCANNSAGRIVSQTPAFIKAMKIDNSSGASLVTGYEDNRIVVHITLDETGEEPQLRMLFSLVVPARDVLELSDLPGEMVEFQNGAMSTEDVIRSLQSTVAQLRDQVRTLESRVNHLTSSQADATTSTHYQGELSDDARYALFVELKNDILNDSVFLDQLGAAPRLDSEYAQTEGTEGFHVPRRA